MQARSGEFARTALRWLALILGIAAANYISGRLGLLLALPPGFATAVWPPSGIALAALLLFGYRVWPGVWLGSFAMNIFIAAQAGPITDWLFAASVAGSIGAGSTAQAALGTWLIRRFVGFPNPLLFEREIALFLLLGGPVSCLLAATVGIGTLVVAGFMPLAVAPFQWWTWWIGDTIGVLTLTPLLMIALAQPRDVWRGRSLSVGLPLVLAFGIAVAFFVYASRAEQARINAAAERQNEQLAGALRANLDRKLDILRAAAGLLGANPQLSRADFRKFLQPILPQAAGVQAIGWNPRVPGEQRADYERRARADGYGIFQFSELQDGVRQAAAVRAEYFPAYYLEPEAGNAAALGFDLASDPLRANMLERARNSGLPAASEPITLVQEAGQQHGVLVVYPVYRVAAHEDTPSERRENLSGYAVLVLRIGDLVTTALGSSPEGVVLALGDTSAPETNRELLAPSAEPGGAWTPTAIEFADRRWQLRVAPTAAAAAAQRSLVAWTVLAGGMLFTSLLGAFLLAVTGRATHVRGLMEDARSTLARLQDAQAQLVQAEKLASLGALVAGISHEVNTPLGISVTAASTLADGAAALQRDHQAGAMTRSNLERFIATAGESTQIILRNLQRAADLIHSFKQVAVDQSSGERRSFALREYIDDVLQSLAPQLKKTRHVVDVDCPADLVVDSYPGALAQILTNFVGNSLLHAFEPGAAGSITISARAENGRLGLRYRDNGKGIPPEHHAKIFDPFFTTKRGQGGSGLGLHIVFNLVHSALGGSLTVNSAPGRGAEFILDLPLRAPERPSR